MSLEALYSKLAAGTAKYRPRGPVDISVLDGWMTTTEIMRIIRRTRPNTLHWLHRLCAEGLVEHRRRRNGAQPMEWRRIKKENNEHEC